MRGKTINWREGSGRERCGSDREIVGSNGGGNTLIYGGKNKAMPMGGSSNRDCPVFKTNNWGGYGVLRIGKRSKWEDKQTDGYYRNFHFFIFSFFRQLATGSVQNQGGIFAWHLFVTNG
jgi:hypothetical protein